MNAKNIKTNSLIPELSVSDIKKSLQFYVDILGFTISHQREKEGFAFIYLGESQLMLDQIGKGRTWKTEDFKYPLGRGINFQIKVKEIESLLERLHKNNIKLFLELEEKWYQMNDVLVGQKQFIVQDPDGYLLRFYEELGIKPCN